MASLPLLPDSGQRLVGIARLAAHGESIREGHNVEYFALPAKSILNRCVSKRNMRFAWTINPYRGCEFACKYCYARYTHEFMEMRDGVDFERKIYVKQHAADLLRQEMRHVKPDEEIAIGAATDPYQPAERRYEVTRGILEVLAEQSGVSAGLITKSNLVLRDIDLMREISRRNHFSVSLTITTMDVDLARILEPRAPRPDLRMEAVQKLNEAGICAGVSCAPVLPGITDNLRNLEAVAKAASAAKAQYIFGNALFLKPCSAAVFLPFLEKEFPALVKNYRERYKDHAFLPKTYQQRIVQLVHKLREKYGLYRREKRELHPLPSPPAEAQMGLFG